MSLEKRLKRNFKFDKTEKHEFIFSAVIIAIILFMFMWRITDYTIITGITGLILSLIISFVSLFIFIGGIKFFAIGKGYIAKYSYWMGGMLGGFLLSFIIYGAVPIVFPGIVELKTNDRLRHGEIFIGENKVDVFWTLASGIITTIIFSFMLLLIYSITQIQIIYFAALLNSFIAFFAMLPFPKNIGLHMFYMRKKTYFYFLAASAFVLTITISKNILTLIIGMILFIIITYLLNKVIKKHKITA